MSCNSERPTLLRVKKLGKNNYYISPKHSGESDIDDSDADPHYSKSPSSSSDSEVEPVEDENLVEEEDGTVQHENLPDEEGPKSKKRKANPDKWNVKKSKYRRNCRKAYVSSSKTKKEFPARRLRPPCGDKCSAKIDETARENLFSSYWKLGDVQRHRCPR